MTRLPEILGDLADADAVADTLRAMAETAPLDPVLRVNLEAVQRRRRDLANRLATLLREKQLDFIQYRTTLFDGTVPPAAAVARSLLAFQTLVTAVFDAVRTTPKRRNAPSSENLRLSALSIAAPPGDRGAIGLTIPNERLLILETDLGTTFGLLFDLLAARSKTAFRQIAARAGIASVTAAHGWAENAVLYGITTAIGWRKSSDEKRSVTLTHADALLLKTAIEAVSDEEVVQVECDCELAALDKREAVFRIETADGETISGNLADGFPRGGSWTTRRWYVAVLTRASRVRYANGEETVRWGLRSLVAHD